MPHMVPKHLIIARYGSADCPSLCDWQRDKLKLPWRGWQILAFCSCIDNSNILNILSLLTHVNFLLLCYGRLTLITVQLKCLPVFLWCSVLPSHCGFFGFAQTWFRFEFVFPAIWDRSVGGEGPSVPSLPLLSMAFGTYFIWMPRPFKWPIMDILWILWTIPAVIAVEGKLMFSSQRLKAHPLCRLWVSDKAREC